MNINSLNIEKLDPSNLQGLLDFLNSNNFKSEHFFPHPFTLDYLVYLIVNRTKDFYCVIKLNDSVIAYGILRGWEEGYEIPSLGVAVDRNYRGFGLGEFMCRYLHLISLLKGCKKVRLRVHKDNDVAKALYIKLGYTFREFNDEYSEGILEL